MSALGDALRALMLPAGSAHECYEPARDVLRKHAPCDVCSGTGLSHDVMTGDLVPDTSGLCCQGAGFTPASVEAAIARAEEQERLDAKIFDDARMLADRRARGLTDQDEHAIRARLSAALDRRTHLSAHVAPDRGDP